MPSNKTKPTGKSVEAHLAARATDQQFEDCMALIRLLKKITRKPPCSVSGSTVASGGVVSGSMAARRSATAGATRSRSTASSARSASRRPGPVTAQRIRSASRSGLSL